MKKNIRILVPCDFSRPSLEARKFATDLAAAADGEVIILSVIDMPVVYTSGFDIQPFAYDEMMQDSFEEEARKKYEKIRQANSKVKESFYIQRGYVHTTIKDFVKKKKIDLVVMGTHGASGISEYFYGSNTEKVVRHSPVPVIAIRKARPISTIKKIVFASTFDLKQTQIVQKIKELQELFGARLELLWVNTPENFMRTDEINAMMEDFAKHFKLKKYTLNTQNDTLEQDGILRFATSHKPGLVAMATHGRKGLAHLLTGSVAEDVVNHVTCPIWTMAAQKR